MSINFMNRWSAAPWSQRHPAGAPCRSTSWPSILSQGWPVTHFRCVGVSVDERDERRVGGRCFWACSFRAHFLRVYMFSIGCLSCKSRRVCRSLRASGVIWSALVNRTGTFAQIIWFQNVSYHEPEHSWSYGQCIKTGNGYCPHYLGPSRAWRNSVDAQRWHHQKPIYVLPCGHGSKWFRARLRCLASAVEDKARLRNVRFPTKELAWMQDIHQLCHGTFPKLSVSSGRRRATSYRQHTLVLTI